MKLFYELQYGKKATGWCVENFLLKLTVRNLLQFAVGIQVELTMFARNKKPCTNDTGFFKAPQR